LIFCFSKVKQFSLNQIEEEREAEVTQSNNKPNAKKWEKSKKH